jgi:hypothetical protein
VVEGDIGTEPLYLFTTLEDPAETIAGLYKERWLIETDLRSLKEQVKLHSISAKTPQMAATELLLAVAAYNLIPGRDGRSRQPDRHGSEAPEFFTLTGGFLGFYANGFAALFNGEV